MEMEKQFIDLVGHVFTLEWALLALPLSLIFSLLVNRVIPGLILAIIAVPLHHVLAIALPLVFQGETAGLSEKIQAAAQTVEPLSLAAELVAFAFLIVVFSLTRQDMDRPSVLE